MKLGGGTQAMAKNSAELTICFTSLLIVGALLFVNKSLSASALVQDVDPSYGWVVHGLRNILGYSVVLLPGYAIYRYIHKTNYLDKTGNNCFAFVIRKCFDESHLINYTNANASLQQPRTLLQEAVLLLFFFIGLQLSFLTWGVLQEKIMTQEYKDIEGNGGYFTDSQFLVFVNKVLAFIMSGTVILVTRQPKHRAPLYKYAFCSISNIISSWCQYEALKYVSFPHQVLGKAAKTIPVMIVGKIISRTKYEYYEYITAIMLSVGMLLFMLDTGNGHKASTVTTVIGIVLLCLYITFDSFTSNWQGALFKQYEMKPVQMMCAVNLFSCIFTAVALMQQGGFVASFNFMLQYPQFVVDCVLLSVCSASGQLFIFKTIATFGPLVFAIVTTIRQGFSVLLSCIIYRHPVSAVGIFGIVLVFCSVFLRIYCGYRIRIIRRRAQNAVN